MKVHICVILQLFVSLQIVSSGTLRPIIGIIAQPSIPQTTPPSQFLIASYVKWIESAGGRVVPILYPLSLLSLSLFL